MEGVESKSESQGQDGQIASENSLRLAETLQGFQQCVKEILNLTQEELNKQISLLKNSLADQEYRWNADIERLEEEIRAKTEETVEALRVESDSKEARNRELNEEVNGFKADISNRDDAIKELNDKIAQMTVAHAAEKDRLNTDINRLNAKIGEMTELAVGWKQKHDAQVSYTKEVKEKVANLAREVMLDDAV